MQGSRRGAVIDVPFASPVHELLPVEGLGRQRLFALHGRAALERHERLTFGLLVLGTGGSGRHVVDGEVVGLDRGTVLTVLPGQVHRHVPDSLCQAVLVLWRAEAAPAGLSLTSGPGGEVFRTDSASFDALLALSTEIEREVRAFDGSVASTRALNALLAALLWRTQRLAERAGALVAASHHHPLYDAFRDQLERRVCERPSVAGLAAELGWSTRSLTRVCRETTGRSAKDLVDERVALEARRLLLQTPLPVGAVGRRLGFEDPARFGAWFRRCTGSSPAAFRREHDPWRGEPTH
jgi:AraC-like DNA-binding protein